MHHTWAAGGDMSWWTGTRLSVVSFKCFLSTLNPTSTLKLPRTLFFLRIGNRSGWNKLWALWLLIWRLWGIISFVQIKKHKDMFVYFLPSGCYSLLSLGNCKASRELQMCSTKAGIFFTVLFVSACSVIAGWLDVSRIVDVCEVWNWFESFLLLSNGSVNDGDCG